VRTVRRHQDVDRRIAHAFWLRAPGCGEIRPVGLPEPGPADVVVRTVRSGISRGTETLVFRVGANSLLMARFNARLRDRAGALPPVSMKDVYLHPTVRRLAASLCERELATPAWDEPEMPEPVGAPHYLLCGALQLLTFVAYAGLAAVGLDAGEAWLAAGHGALNVYVRAVVFGVGVLLGTGLLPIVAKWVLVGRFTPRRIRVWSFAYFRFWIVKTLIVSNPVAHLLAGYPLYPLYPLYLRALGARIGRRTLILTHHAPVCADLLSVGHGTVIRKGAFLNGYRAREGAIEIGPIALGEQAFVGEGSMLDASNRQDGTNSPGLAQRSSCLWSREDAPFGFNSRATGATGPRPSCSLVSVGGRGRGVGACGQPVAAERLSTRAIRLRVIATTRGSGASGASGDALGTGSRPSSQPSVPVSNTIAPERAV
jgi:hypothetical protein